MIPHKALDERYRLQQPTSVKPQRADDLDLYERPVAVFTLV